MDTADIDFVALGQLRPHKITTDEYYRMAEMGVIRKEMRVELLWGQVIDMAPIGPRHQLIVDELSRILITGVGAGTAVRVQGPIRLSQHHAPQPDISLFNRRWQAYPTDHPGPADIHLLIEVADSSLAEDSTIKAELYASFGIPEYWIVDLTKDKVIVHRNPESGVYGDIRALGRGESLRAVALPDVTVIVAEIFD